jgi:hypothetical protein
MKNVDDYLRFGMRFALPVMGNKLGALGVLPHAAMA